MTLVAFDFDGTLSDDEMLVLLGEEAGCANEIEEITTRAMNGELSYAESLRERAGLLDGLSVTDAEAAYDRVFLRAGAGDLLRTLNEAGVKTAIVTGGFNPGVERALAHENTRVDVIVANDLPVTDGHLAGTVEGPLIEETKDDALNAIASDLGVDITETVAVGDGANDIPMLDAAGISIGFRPKPTVEPHCDTIVHSMSELTEALGELEVI